MHAPDEDLGLDLRAPPPAGRWSRVDIGCALLLAVCFGSCAVCVLSPTGGVPLDEANVEATQIVLRKLAARIDALGALPSAEALDALAGPYRADAWGDPVQYYSACHDGRGAYTLVSLGKDGRDGGEDWNKDIRLEGPLEGALACP